MVEGNQKHKRFTRLSSALGPRRSGLAIRHESTDRLDKHTKTTIMSNLPGKTTIVGGCAPLVAVARPAGGDYGRIRRAVTARRGW
jgi:hypothetical protein